MRGALVLDWDWSTVNENTDTWVPGRLDATLLGYIKSQSAAGVQWTSLMADVSRRLHAKGVKPADIDRVLCEIPVFKEILQAIQLAHDHGLGVYVVSDANEVYIGTIARHHGIAGYLTAVVTNRAAYAPSGLLVIEPHQPRGSPHGCKLCPVNLCKGLVMDRLGLSWPGGAAGAPGGGSLPPAGEAATGGTRRSRSRSRSPGPAITVAGGGGAVGALITAAGHAVAAACRGPASDSAVARGEPLERPRILYLGDGGGDLCACLRLGPDDVICARADYPLLAALRSRPRRDVRATVQPWRNGRDVLAAVEAFIASLQPPQSGGAWLRETLRADAASIGRGLAGGGGRRGSRGGSGAGRGGGTG